MTAGWTAGAPPALPPMHPEVRAVVRFLQTLHDSSRETVTSLLDEVADACDADVEFYSVPGGRGRREVEMRGVPEAHSSGFILICTTLEDGPVHRPASGEVLRVLEAAAAGAEGPVKGVAIGRCAAVAVRTSLGLEGILALWAKLPEALLEGSGPIDIGGSFGKNGFSEDAVVVRATALEHAARLLQDEASAIRAGGFAVEGIEDPVSGLAAGGAGARARDIAERMEAVTSEYVSLLEAFPSAFAPTAPAPVTAMEILPMARLFGLLLAERLERMHWQRQASAASKAMSETVYALQALQDEPDPNNRNHYAKLLDAVNRTVPHEVLRGDVVADRIDIWTLDAVAGQMVLNNSGRLDGLRVPVGMSIVGEAAKCNSHIRFTNELTETERKFNSRRRSVAASQPDTIICVPLPQYQPPDGLVPEASEAAVATVVEFSTHSSVGQADLKTARRGRGAVMRRAGVGAAVDHFALAAAEALRSSVLPVALRLRDSLMALLSDMHQHQGVAQIAEDLGRASDFSDLVELVERDVPTVMDCEHCTLFFVSEELGEVWAPPSRQVPHGIQMCIGQGVAGFAAEEALRQRDGDGGIGHALKSMIVENDPSSNPHWNDNDDPIPSGTRNWLIAPLFSWPKSDQVLGLIQLVNKKEDSGQEDCEGFVDSDKDLLMALLRECSSHMQRFMMEIIMAKASMGHGFVGTDMQNKKASMSLVESYYYVETGARDKKNKTKTVVRGFECAQVARILGMMQMKPDGSSRSEDWLLVRNNLKKDYLLAEITESELGIDDWQTDYWSLSPKQEFTLLMQALQRSGILSQVALPHKEILHNYFNAVKVEYTDAQYHNFHHAMSTVHYAYKLTMAGGLSHLITKTGWFALIIGSLTHDTGHRGRNNAFEVLTRSVLALRYNDVSVLENHSCARAFEIALQLRGCNIFHEMAIEEYGQVRKQMVSAIIATDMQYHMDHVKMMQDFDPKDDDMSNSQALLETMMHAADISNPVMPAELSQRWGKAVSWEFAAQAAEEASLGIPTASHMQNLDDPVVSAKNTLGFIDFVIMPFFGPMFRNLDGLADVQGFLKANREAAAALTMPAGRDSSHSSAATLRSRASFAKLPSYRSGGAEDLDADDSDDAE